MIRISEDNKILYNKSTINGPSSIRSNNANKSNPIHSIPLKLVRNNSDIFIPILHNNFNNNINNETFPDNLKVSDIIPTHKKKERILKSNHRPISLLPAISKIYEKLMENQLNKYLESKLS